MEKEKGILFNMGRVSGSFHIRRRKNNSPIVPRVKKIDFHPRWSVRYPPIKGEKAGERGTARPIKEKILAAFFPWYISPITAMDKTVPTPAPNP